MSDSVISILRDNITFKRGLDLWHPVAQLTLWLIGKSGCKISVQICKCKRCKGYQLWLGDKIITKFEKIGVEELIRCFKKCKIESTIFLGEGVCFGCLEKNEDYLNLSVIKIYYTSHKNLINL